MSELGGLSREQSSHFREDLKLARMRALDDSESFAPIIHAIERLGHFLRPDGHSLSDYAEDLLALASGQPDARPFGTPIGTLLRLITDERNAAQHVGSVARALTDHLIEFALHLERGLMHPDTQVSDLMVRSVVTAFMWHPVSFVRHEILRFQFTSIPFHDGTNWRLVLDAGLARWLQSRTAEKLRLTLEQAIAPGDQLPTVKALTLRPNLSPGEALSRMGDDNVTARNGAPALVLDEGRLVGIVSAYDLL